MEDITGTARAPVLGAEALRRRLLLLEADSDAMLADLAVAAEDVAQDATRLVPQRRTFRMTAPAGAWRFWWFPARPVVSVEAVNVLELNGTLTPLTAGTHYALSDGFAQPHLQMMDAAADLRGGRALQVDAVMGFGAGACPAKLLEAMGRLVKEWRDAYAAAAEEGEALAAPRMSMGARALMRQARYVPPFTVWPQ